MGRRIDPSLGGPIELFLVPASAPRLVYYPLCGMMHIKEPLLLIGKSGLCCGSGFPLWFPYVRRHITVNTMC